MSDNSIDTIIVAAIAAIGIIAFTFGTSAVDKIVLREAPERTVATPATAVVDD
jgi:hypothetical protein